MMTKSRKTSPKRVGKVRRKRASRNVWVREWRGRATRAASSTAQNLDPRVAKQRVIAAATVSTKRRFFALLGAGLFSFAVLVVVLLQTPLFSVETVEVAGSTHYSADDIAEGSGVRGRALVTLPIAEVESQIEAMPWIATAAVERVWPNQIDVVVTERTPVAVAPADGGWYLVDATGRVLAQATERPVNLVALVDVGEINGPGSTLATNQRGALAVGALAPLELVSQIEGVVADDDATVRVVLLSGVIVRFGTATDVPAKFQALATVLAEIENAETVGQIDVRASGTPVVTPK
jgi:cell division protein FtsQ